MSAGKRFKKQEKPRVTQLFLFFEVGFGNLFLGFYLLFILYFVAIFNAFPLHLITIIVFMFTEGIMDFLADGCGLLYLVVVFVVLYGLLGKQRKASRT
jgi:hypothetical protein